MESVSLGLLSATLEKRGSDRARRQEMNAVGQSGRFIWSVLKAVCLFAALSIALYPAIAAAQNPIVLENQQPGTSAWYPPGNTGSDATGQIRAYMSATSVNKGGSINFKVSVNPAQTYSIDVYRLGWYQGLGGRLMQHITGLNGTTQPTCPVNATTGLIECNWATGYTLTTQTSWTSGVYVAVLTNAQNFQSYAHFVVRDDSRTAALVYQLPDNTFQAYNDYPYNQTTGKSLYSFNSYGANTVGGTKAAVKVSYDRPYNYDGDCGVWGYCVLSSDAAFIHWLEKSGYDVTYISDVDTHANGAQLLNYRGFINGGHNEYWSKAMYDSVLAARDHGVNLGFFSANTIYWQVRYEPSSSGVPNRVIVCYRDLTIDPTTDPSLTTVNWRDPILNRPEQTLVGIMYSNIVDTLSNGSYATYVVNNSGNWVYAGTGFHDGDTVAGVVGYESDRLFSNYPGPTAVAGTYTLLSHSPFKAGGVSDYGNSSVYQATSGAWVFASGTINWANTLDSFSPSGTNIVDARMQQTTANILNRFVSGTPQADFSLAGSPASQAVTPGAPTSYGVTITPSNGFTGQVTLSVSGLPTGAGGSFSPNPATSTSTLSVTTGTNTPPGTYTLTITGISGSLTHTATVTLVVNGTPDFTLGASPGSQTVIQGGSTTYTATVTPSNGFSGQVTLSANGLPTGASGSFSPNPATSTSTFSVTTGASTPVGTYTVTITGVSGTLTHTATVTLVVATPDFALSASPASQTVSQGRSTTYGVTITPVLGFGGQVTLSVSGLPTGATGSFSPNPATASSTLTVTTLASTTIGTYTLTITGVSGALIHTTTVSLTVAPAGVVYDNKVSAGFDFGITKLVTPAFTIGTGPNRAAMIMVAMSANTATNITASLGGVAGTLIPGTDSGTTASGRTMIFQVINPPSGAQNATVQWTGSMNADIGVITVSGADQGNPTNNGTFSAANSSPAATTSVTITSNPGDLTASIGYTGDNWKTPFTNQTLKWGVDSGVAGADIGPGTGTTTHTWTDDYAGQLHAVSGANFKATSASDFTLSATPASQTVAHGNPTSYGITVSPMNGFTGQVTLNVTGLPTGAAGSFSPNPATGSSTLSVTTDATTTPAGTYTLTITGVGGGLTHTATVTLVVTAPDFTLSPSPASQSVNQGNPTSYGVTINPTSGFAGQVNLSVTGLPTGAGGSFDINPATATSTLSVTTDPVTTPTGTYTLTITGVSGSLTHTTTVTLVVTAPDFSLTPSPASQSVNPGSPTSYSVTINATNGFAGQVTLSASGLPTDATGSFTTNPATLSSSFSVTTASTTPPGTYTVTITGVSGSLTHTTTATLVVNTPDFSLTRSPASQTVAKGDGTSYGVTINPTNGFAGQVTMSVTGLPTGATGTFSPNPATASSTLSVTTDAATTPAGSYTLTITGVSGSLTHTTTVTLAVADFSLSPSPASQTVVKGSGTSYGVTINPTNGFAGQVTLSVSGLPTGAGGSFAPNPATASSTLSVTTDATTTPAGTYTLTITGISGSLTHTTTVALVVNATDFGLTPSPASQTVVKGSGTSYGVTINPLNGFSGQVTMSVTGLPTGATGTFSPNPATASSTLSVTTDAATTPAGSYTLTITGISGTLTHTTTVTLVVNAPDFTLTPLPASQTVIQGSPTSYGITINPTNGFASGVTLSVTGLPAGATGTFSPNPATASSTLSVTTDAATTPAGSYTLTITGISGSLTHTTTVTLVVNAPDFTLTPSPASQTVIQGSPTSYGVTINPTNGFAGQVTLSVTGLPTGAGGTFAPNPATTTSTLSVTTVATTPAGTYTLTITGVSGTLTHTTTVTLVVTASGTKQATTTTMTSSLNPSLVGQAVTFTATVSSAAGGTPTGTVTFKQGATVLGTGTLNNGQATFTTTSLVAGTKNYTAAYGGDANYNTSTSTALSQTVTKNATTTTVTSSLNPSIYGQTVTFTATVSSAIGAPPDGETVTFKRGSTTLGTGKLSGGIATFSTSTLNAGAPSITATYATDPKFLASTSPAITQTVSKAATTISLAAAPNPSALLQSVTFTATLTSSTGAIPTGSVTFKDGATTLGTGTLDATGTATFSTTTLTAGSHSITASYAATTNFLASTSTSVTQVVQ